jgi:hypothetical protein
LVAENVVVVVGSVGVVELVDVDVVVVEVVVVPMVVGPAVVDCVEGSLQTSQLSMESPKSSHTKQGEQSTSCKTREKFTKKQTVVHGAVAVVILALVLRVAVAHRREWGRRGRRQC